MALCSRPRWRAASRNGTIASRRASTWRERLAAERVRSPDALHRTLEARFRARHPRPALVEVCLGHLAFLEATYGRRAVLHLTHEVASRIVDRLRAVDSVAVAAAGSVLVLLAEVADRDMVLTVVERLAEVLETPFRLGGQEVRIEAAFAAAAAPLDGRSAQGLTLALETAAAQLDARERVTWPPASASADLADGRRRRIELLEAAGPAQFFPLFQPQVDLKTGCFTRLEVLMRWRRVDGRIAGPGDFLDDLRDLGRLVAVSQSVYAAALAEVRGWIDRGLEIERVALNLDVSQVQTPGWAEPLLDLIEASGLGAARVELEISEHILQAADIPTLAAGLEHVREAGALVSLDDFGAGYGSLTQLARLPVDLVKLDATLLWGAEQAERIHTLVEGVVALTEALGLPCVFEGVETEGQLDLARNLQARFAQGYHLGRPMPAPQLEAFLAQRRSLPADPFLSVA